MKQLDLPHGHACKRIHHPFEPISSRSFLCSSALFLPLICGGVVSKNSVVNSCRVN